MRIFISSPSDLAPERQVILHLIGRLAEEFKHHFPVTPVLWEHEPLLATEHFQEGLVSPAECDIVFCMLWSRVGSALPEQFRRADGTAGITGTEWEFQIAAQAAAEAGKPEILVYRKTAPVQVSLEDPEALERARKQKQAVDAFFDSQFHNDDDEHTFSAAYWPFEDIDTLEDMATQHLRALLRDHVGGDDEADAEQARVQWHQGSPFRGLQSFDLEHAAIFFGRNRSRNELFRQFQTQVDQTDAFVMVLGTSGSGKSSLVKAGLVPMLLTPKVIPGVAEVRFGVMRPSDNPEDPLDALLRCICQPGCLPELCADTDLAELRARLDASPHALETLVFSTLGQIARDAGYRADLSVKLLLVVDQFEELFTLPSFSQADRTAFVSLLHSLVSSGHTWVIGTMRSDFYAQSESVPELVALMRGNGQFHLTVPTGEEIGQMISLPARVAGLRFERDADGIGVDEVLRQAAVGEQSILPLLSFTLDQLFQRRDGNRLTHQALRELGGVEGAITAHAEAVFAGLPVECQRELPELLRALVAIRSDDAETVGGRHCAWAVACDGPSRQQLAEAFIAARLLVVAGEPGSADATVSLAHEALLRSWQRARDWVADNLDYLRLRARIVTMARTWAAEDRPEGMLLPEGRLLEQGLAIEFGEGESLESEFVRASAQQVEAEQVAADRSARALRNRRRQLLIAVAAVVVGVLIGGFLVNQGMQAQQELTRLAEEREQRVQRSRVESYARVSLDQTHDGDSLNGIHLGLEAIDRAAATGADDSGGRVALQTAVWAQPMGLKLAARLGSAGTLRAGNTAGEPGSLLLDGDGLLLLSSERGLTLLEPERTRSLAGMRIPGETARVAAMNASGKLLALLGDSRVEIRAVDDDSIRHAWRAPAGAEGIAFEREGERLVVWGGAAISVLSPSAPRPTQIEVADGARIESVELEDDRILVSTREADQVQSHLYDATTGRRMTQFRQGHAVRCAGDVCISWGDDPGIDLFDRKTGFLKHTLLHGAPLASVAMTEASLVAIDATGVLYSWSLEGTLLATRDAPRRFLADDQDSGDPDVRTLTRISPSPWVVLREGRNVTAIHGLELRPGPVLHALSTSAPVVVGADTVALATGNNQTEVFEPTRGQTLVRITADYEIEPAAISTKYLATRAFGHIVDVWDLATGVRVASLAAESDLASVAFDGDWVIGSGTRSSTVWNLARPQGPQVRVSANRRIDSAVAVSAGGERVATVRGSDVLVEYTADAARRRVEMSAPVSALGWRGDRLLVGLESRQLVELDAQLKVRRTFPLRGVPTELFVLGDRVFVSDADFRLVPVDEGAEPASHWSRITAVQTDGEGDVIVSTRSGITRWRWEGSQPRLIERQEVRGRLEAVVGSDPLLSIVRAPGDSSVVFDIERDEVVGVLPVAGNTLRTYAISADGSMVAAETFTGALKLWAFADGVAVERLHLRGSGSAQGLAEGIGGGECGPGRNCRPDQQNSIVRLSSDGQLLLHSEGSVRARVVDIGSRRTVFSADEGDLEEHVVVGFGADNRSILLEGPRGIERYALPIEGSEESGRETTLTPLKPFTGQMVLRGATGQFLPIQDAKVLSEAAAVWSAVDSVLAADAPSGRVLARLEDGQVAVLDALRGQLIASLSEPAERGGFSADGSHFWLWAEDEIALWPLYDAPIETVARQLLGSVTGS